MEIDITDVVNLYENERFTLRMIADKYHTNHHMIKRILLRNGIEITKRNTLKPFTQEHKNKISATRKKRFASGEIECWAKGKKMTEACRRKNMAHHLKYDISPKRLDKYDDIDRLIFLNKVLSRRRHIDDIDNINVYLEFIDKFYFDSTFNKIYDDWVAHDKNKWYMPSFDHMTSKCNNGECSIKNMQCITWFENRAKAEMNQDEWIEFRKVTNTRSDLFHD